MKQGNQNYGDRCKEIEDDILCNIKEHDSYLDVGYEDLQNFDFVQSDEEESNAEFSMINPNLLDIDLEDSDSVSNAPAVPTVIDNIPLPNSFPLTSCSQQLGDINFCQWTAVSSFHFLFT